MKSEQGTAFAVVRRRGAQREEPPKLPHSNSQKDVDLLFTTKYIDTLNDLHRIQEENKRLMLRVRNLEAQIVPAGKNSQHTFIKMLAPSCLEYHQEERKLNRALQDENEMLRRQFQNSVNAAAEANEKLSDALNRIKMMELEIVGKVDEVRQSTQAQHAQEIKKMQENLVDLERRWGLEKKQITMDRDSYALQCESLKVDAAAARSLLAEMTKQGNPREEMADLRMRLEILEREKLELQQKLAQSKIEIGRLNEKMDEFAELTETLQLVSQDQIGDFAMHIPSSKYKALERDASKGALTLSPDGIGNVVRSRSSEKLSQLGRNPLNKSMDKAPNSSSKGGRNGGDAQGREVHQLAGQLNDALGRINKLESELAALTAKNKELAKSAEQSRIIAEGVEAQNETLTMEVRRLSDKLRSISHGGGGGGGEGRASSAQSSVRPGTPPSHTPPSSAPSPPVFPSVKNGGGNNGKRKPTKHSSSGRIRGVEDSMGEPPEKTRPPPSKPDRRELSSSLASVYSPSSAASPWTGSGSGTATGTQAINGHKILSPKKSF